MMASSKAAIALAVLFVSSVVLWSHAVPSAQQTGETGVQAPAAPENATPAQPVEDAESYAIYSMLVPKEFAGTEDLDQYKQWLIAEETIAWPPPGQESMLQTCFRVPEREKAQYESMIADYQRQNAGPRKLLTKLNLAKMYSLLSQDGVDSYEAATEPEKPRRVRRLPSWLEGAPGLISFSAIGYSRDRKLALVYVEHECAGEDCGGGSPHVLKKVNNTWQEQNVISCRWVPS